MRQWHSHPACSSRPSTNACMSFCNVVAASMSGCTPRGHSGPRARQRANDEACSARGLACVSTRGRRIEHVPVASRCPRVAGRAPGMPYADRLSREGRLVHPLWPIRGTNQATVKRHLHLSVATPAGNDVEARQPLVAIQLRTVSLPRGRGVSSRRATRPTSRR